MDKAVLNQLEHEMWSIAKELKNRKNSPSWKKMGFFKDWLKAVMELVDEGEKLKPAEPTIAFLTKTNAYLTRKLNELESNKAPAPQMQVQDPNTQATPMAASTCLTWVTVAATLAKPIQQPAHKTTKTTQPSGTTQDPSADPCCLIIQIQPPIPTEERPNRIEVRKKINDMLDQKGVPQFF